MLLSIGELILDITITPESPVQANDDTPAGIRLGGGGQAANFCAWAAHLGEKARLIARLGDDESGRRLAAEIEASGVAFCPVWGPEPSGTIAILVGPDGRRSMFTQHGAGTALRPADLRPEWFDGVDLIHVPAYAFFIEPLAAAARAAIDAVRALGGQVSIDLSSVAGLREYGRLRMIGDLRKLAPDLVFASAAEADELGTPLDRLTRIPVVKLGAAGCIVLGKQVAAPLVHEVDPTGAGDAFAAAFCVSHLRGRSPLEAAKAAVQVASAAVTRVGARPA
jgi:sugar/nucleoside kinase (ribokinase family)